MILAGPRNCAGHRWSGQSESHSIVVVSGDDVEIHGSERSRENNRDVGVRDDQGGEILDGGSRGFSKVQRIYQRDLQESIGPDEVTRALSR